MIGACEARETGSIHVRSIGGVGLMAARPARTSLIYHLGLEGLGELAMEDEPEERVSRDMGLADDRDSKVQSRYEVLPLN